ncbi:hypothetical protein MicvaDRAFT_3320 [Microcoleus vaginatus FGP-2]|nr:hypothetical protein MicvaDRAFT_3320 [Microcoleus vaginatus FGP-2]
MAWASKLHSLAFRVFPLRDFYTWLDLISQCPLESLHRHFRFPYSLSQIDEVQ